MFFASASAKKICAIGDLIALILRASGPSNMPGIYAGLHVAGVRSLCAISLWLAMRQETHQPVRPCESAFVPDLAISFGMQTERPDDAIIAFLTDMAAQKSERLAMLRVDAPRGISIFGKLLVMPAAIAAR